MIILTKELQNKDAWLIDREGRPYTLVIISRKLLRKVIVDEGLDQTKPNMVFIWVEDIRGPNSIPVMTKYATESRELASLIKDIKHRIVPIGDTK